jgi:hypothetical protein
MFGFRSSRQRLAVVVSIAAIFAVIFALAPAAQAQGRRNRRESNANRKARIQREIENTYNHRYELFGGGGFLRFRSGEYLQRNSEVTWATAGNYFLNPKLAITADIRGADGWAKVGNSIYDIKNPLITEYTLQGGATYRFYAKQKFAISATALGGYALGNFDGGSKAISATLLGLWATSNRPVITGGVNFDYNIYPNIAFRVTPTYVGTMFRGVNLPSGTTNGTIQNNVGFNAGIIVRFGKIGKK